MSARDGLALEIAGMTKTAQKLYEASEELLGQAQRMMRLFQALPVDHPTVTAFSQRDARWSGEPLGDGTALIGQVGCLVSAAASMLCDAGMTTDPSRLNSWLRGTGGYANGNLFVWTSLDKLGIVRFVELVNCPTPESTPIGRMVTSLATSGYCIGKVDFHPGGALDQHWVRVLEISSAEATIMDPWPVGPESNLIDLCPKYGKTPALALWAVGFYEKASGI
jgi:hypothetical protein